MTPTLDDWGFGTQRVYVGGPVDAPPERPRHVRTLRHAITRIHLENLRVYAKYDQVKFVQELLGKYRIRADVAALMQNRTPQQAVERLLDLEVQP